MSSNGGNAERSGSEGNAGKGGGTAAEAEANEEEVAEAVAGMATL